MSIDDSSAKGARCSALDTSGRRVLVVHRRNTRPKAEYTHGHNRAKVLAVHRGNTELKAGHIGMTPAEATKQQKIAERHIGLEGESQAKGARCSSMILSGEGGPRVPS